jgi:hypothetical protein
VKERKRREVEQGAEVIGRGAFERWGREDKVERREGAGKRLDCWMQLALLGDSMLCNERDC